MTKDELKSNILLVEDNKSYSDVAKEIFEKEFKKELGVEELQFAHDYEGATRIIEYAHSKMKGALVDCFFNQQFGSSRHLGREVAERIVLANTLEEFIWRAKDTSRSEGYRERARRELERLSNGINLSKHLNEYDPLISAVDQTEIEYSTPQAKNQPLGILVAEGLQILKIPFVLVTSAYHHDKLTQPIYEYAHRRGMSILDCPQNKPGAKATPEFWREAYNQLHEKIQGEK